MYEFSPALVMLYVMFFLLCTYWIWVTSMRIFQLPELRLKSKIYAILAKCCLWLSFISLLCLMIYAMSAPAEHPDNFFSEVTNLYAAVHSRHFLWYLVPMLAGVFLSIALINAMPEAAPKSEGTTNE